MKVDVENAKVRLIELLDKVASGEEVVITVNGKATAYLVAIASGKAGFRVGSARGEFTVPDDFDDPLPKEIEDLFYE